MRAIIQLMQPQSVNPESHSPSLNSMSAFRGVPQISRGLEAVEAASDTSLGSWMSFYDLGLEQSDENFFIDFGGQVIEEANKS